MKTSSLFPFYFLLILFYSCQTREVNSKDTFSPLIITQNSFALPESVFGDVENYEMTYESDGLTITGYIFKPKAEGTYPVVLTSRGGNRDFGTYTIRSFDLVQELANEGYVVIATQLRGNKFSDGVDEMGGKDLNDILRLIDIAKSIDFMDHHNIGMYGISRGGLNTYQISRLTDEVKAIAVVGAPVDPRIDFESRPKMYERVYKQMIGDSIENRAAYDYRSPIKWVSEINEPVLLLHGLDDWRVLPINAQLMEKELTRLGKSFKAIILEDGNHSLSSHTQLRNDTIIEWFDQYLKSDAR